MDSFKAKELISRYRQGLASQEECRLVEQWFLIDLEMSTILPDQKAFERTDERISAELALHIGKPKSVNKMTVRRLWYRIGGVAAVLALITLGIWLYNSQYSGISSENPFVSAKDILPGKNTAMLTLANGKVITLSESKIGVVIAEEGLKYNDGTEVAASAAQAQMLTASTPRGGTYQVTLPDGTHVWLNADSKLSFPSKFSGPERKVLLKGEAYFEVAKSHRAKAKGDQSKSEPIPFIVATDKQEVTVLGTHFNINSYSDEAATKTTLLEGSVRVVVAGTKSASTAFSYILKPGEQAINNGNIRVEKVDLEEAVAWKNGNIVFTDRTLESIMRELSRWYEVDVVYMADAPKYEIFSGAVSRTRNISSVLERMQTTGSVRFKVEGRTITVTK
ncbi:FecR family protein [Pedobacter hiemivivus]|uniref:FecR family protein n=1 Tax=Pedobacter hiemivivus TaxID=2530454 RepID=A0A4R0NDG7_9SPHI|nr:FecR family protein [Pedobacter hiemivivus]TCC96544.1 FecR family protein [Pedobacter hiemivivus]